MHSNNEFNILYLILNTGLWLLLSCGITGFCGYEFDSFNSVVKYCSVLL